MPFGTEIAFGKKDSPIQSRQFEGMTLVGVMDRIDKYEPQSEVGVDASQVGHFVRLIDYKSGYAKFAFADVFLGKKLQLVAYLGVLMDNGFLPAGSFYFPVKDGWDDDEFSHRLVGIFRDDLDTVTHLDKGLSKHATDGQGKESEVFGVATHTTKTKGFCIAKRNDYALEDEQIQGLKEYSFAMIEQAIVQMKKGNIVKNPLAQGNKAVCGMCPYWGVCTSSGEPIQERVVMGTLGLGAFVDTQDK